MSMYKLGDFGDLIDVRLVFWSAVLCNTGFVNFIILEMCS